MELPKSFGSPHPRRENEVVKNPRFFAFYRSCSLLFISLRLYFLFASFSPSYNSISPPLPSHLSVQTKVCLLTLGALGRRGL